MRETTRAIFDGLQRLGLDWDEDVVHGRWGRGRADKPELVHDERGSPRRRTGGRVALGAKRTGRTV